MYLTWSTYSWDKYKIVTRSYVMILVATFQYLFL